MDNEKNLNNISLTEFRNMEYKKPEKPFTSVIIVPMRELHDSGYRTMKFILTRGDEIIGVVGGGSDVIHINGIGGYGKFDVKKWIESMMTDKMVPLVGWTLDCLPKSNCLRLFAGRELEIDDFIGSDFCIYAKEPLRGTR